jgi:hypothetical protein
MATGTPALNPLAKRLGAMRRRFRVLVVLRSLAWISAILLAAISTSALIDWRLHLPGLVRAFLLGSTLSAVGLIAYRLLLRPLCSRADDLCLALRVEAQHPVFNDALASAVQFLEQPAGTEDGGSTGLRREAVRRALNLARNYDFKAAIDERDIGMASLALAGSAGLALILILASPRLALTGLQRFAQPFTVHDWPCQTVLEVFAKSQSARGAAFEIQVKVHGVIPATALVDYSFEKVAPVEQMYDISCSPESDDAGFVAHLEAARVQGPFRFQVRANDAVSPWQDVEVLPPPQIVALHGRASPQIHLRYPTYTDLPEQDLPDGTNLIEAVAGTQITLRAATDRPITQAWLEFPQEAIPRVAAAAFLNAFGLAPLPATLDLAGAHSGAWRRIPAQLEEDGRALKLELVAQTAGTFGLHVEDELGLDTTRLLEMRAVPDPPPTVQLERPAPSVDAMNVVPDADVMLRVAASDPVFALRTVWLSYRRISVSQQAEPAQGNLLLYHHEMFERAIPMLVAGLTRLPLPPAVLRMRWQHVEAGRLWPIGSLHLSEGDTLVLQARADDFDDLTVGKQPGSSHEVELHVVGRPSLELALNRAEAQIAQELARLEKLQTEALDKIIPAEEQWRSDPARVDSKHVEDVLQAEQLQCQIRARVGTREEGVRADVNRILQTLRNNHLPRSGTDTRMGAAAAELDRLSRAELEQIESRLALARKQSETGDARPLKTEGPGGPLTEARRGQQEVAKTLRELLRLMEPWSSTQEARSEAKSVQLEQVELRRQTEQLSKKIPAGQEPGRLGPEQKGELDRMADLQGKLAARAARLLQKMETIAEDRKNLDPNSAQSLRQAAKLGKEQSAVAKMQEAEGNLRENQLAKAQNKQGESAEVLKQVVTAMDELPEAELDRLIKKMTETEGRLADLADRQDRLQKKVKAAYGNANAGERDKELRRLAREQDRLQQETEDTVRELSRLRAERAGLALSQAGSRMEQASKRLRQSEGPDEQQDDALERINEAREELQQARARAEDELAREKLAKLTDRLKGLKLRQDALRVEESRIHKQVLERREWTRSLGSSWTRLAESQKGLGEETQRLAAEKLASTKAFQHLLTRAADAMARGALRMQARLETARTRRDETPADLSAPLDLGAENSADQEIGTLQNVAVRRIDQLLSALKTETGMPLVPARPTGARNGGDPGSSSRDGADAYPPSAELKALRALQQEINEQTRSLGSRLSRSEAHSPKEKKELEELQQEQHEVASLYQELTASLRTDKDQK